MSTKQQSIRNKKTVHGFLVNVGSVNVPATGLLDVKIIASTVMKPTNRLSLWLKSDEGHHLRYDHELNGSEKSRAIIGRLRQMGEKSGPIRDSSEFHGTKVGLRFEGGWFCGFEVPSPKIGEVAE